MANYFIFGVGGTGSRVIRSLTMLLAAGFKPFKRNDKIFPILIDYDTNNGDTKRTKELIDLYHSIREASYPAALANEERFDNLFFSAPLLEMQEVSNAYHSGFSMKFGAESDQTFEQWTATDQLTNEKDRTQDLMLSLFDDSSDPNLEELKLNMNKGFKGNPNIGSIVFHSLKDSNEFNDFASMCQVGDRVIIIGSLFGGTGSSGIPELVQAIRNDRRTAVKNVELSVVMVCPYFGFRSSDERAVRSSIFNSKTKAALNFYKTSGINDKINAIYYVGDEKTSIYEYSEGEDSQRNNIHFVDLVSALSICHFAELNKETLANGTKYYKYRIVEEDIEDNDRDDDDQENAHRISFVNFIETELDHTFYYLASFALAIRFFHDEISKGTSVVKELQFNSLLNLHSCFKDGKAISADTGNKQTDDLRIVCRKLLEFYNNFVEWNEEFKKHTAHPLYLFNFNGHLYDLIVDGSLNIPQDPRNILGFRAKRDPQDLLKAEADVAERMNEAFNELRGIEAYKISSGYKAFMLMYLLTEGSRKVFLKSEGRSDDRRRHLSSKSLRVVKSADEV